MQFPQPAHDELPSENPPTTLTRAMNTRHVVMLSLGGSIGTGLFLASGEVIAQTGAIAALLAYLFGSLIAAMVMLCLGELAVQMPESGAFGHYATRYIGPATGFMITCIYWLTWSAALGTELTAAALLMQEWFAQIPMWLWTLGFALMLLLFNAYSTHVFAESEFWLALVKVITVIAFLLLGVLAILGVLPFQESTAAPLLQNLTVQGWFPHGLWPIFTTMLMVNFAFSGIELIGVAAGEMQNPQRDIPKSIYTSLWRLLIFFIGTIVVIAALLPVEQLGLNSQQSISHSPFVTIFNGIGIPYAEDVMRFVIVTALLSTANSGLFAASRMLWSLSSQGQLPAIFAKLSRGGTPIVALWVTLLGAVPGLLSELYAPESIFKNLLGVAAFSMVIVWMSICLSQFNFRRRWYQQGLHKQDLAFALPFYPIVPIAGFIFCSMTGLSMLANPAMHVGFLACMLFIALCYISYYIFYRKR